MKYKVKVTRGTRNEAKIAKKANATLKAQKDYLLKNGEDIYSQELDIMGFSGDTGGLTSSQKGALNVFFDNMGVYTTATAIAGDVFKTKDSGYRASFANHGKELELFNITFNINNELLLKWNVDWRDLQLSDKDGAIARTTKRDIADVLQNGIREGQSWQQIADKIETIGTFAPSRARLIATQETGKAFGFGNHFPMLQAQEQGAEVTKKRETVHDAKVREDHLQNQEDGWIALDEPHSGTGDDYAPSESSFNCRCTELYNIK